jgi:hypothetical protein
VTAATASLPLRVRVQDAWDEADLELPPDATLQELKERALARFRIRRDPDGYVVKFRGAEILDETRTLTEVGVVANAALIVLPRRRRPVR